MNTTKSKPVKEITTRCREIREHWTRTERRQRARRAVECQLMLLGLTQVLARPQRASA